MKDFWNELLFEAEGIEATDGLKMPCIESCSEIEWKYTDFLACHWYLLTQKGLYSDQQHSWSIY